MVGLFGDSDSKASNDSNLAGVKSICDSSPPLTIASTHVFEALFSGIQRTFQFAVFLCSLAYFSFIVYFRIINIVNG